MTKRVQIPAAGAPDVTLTFVVRPLRTTGEYVEAQVMMSGVDSGETSVDDVLEFVWGHIEKDAMDYPSLTFDKLAPLVGDVGIGILTTSILSAGFDADVLKGMRRILEIAHKATEYDPSVDPVCECRACQGLVEQDPMCLFEFERPLLSDLAAGWDWDLITECWDLPFYVYQARAEQHKAKARGEAAIYQEQKVEAENKKKAAGIRKKHLGSTDWHDIARQRGA